MLKRHILLAVTALTVSGAASAQTTIYTTRAAFNAAAGTTTFESFESGGSSAQTRNFGAFTASETGGEPNNIVYTDSFVGATDGSNSLNYSDNGSSVFTLTFAQTIYSLGFDISSTSATTIAFGGATSASLALTGLGAQFFGITSATGFTTLTFDASGTSSLGIDALAFSAVNPTASAVPEPASWAMMIGGFGLVGGAARRRRSQRITVRFA